MVLAVLFLATISCSKSEAPTAGREDGLRLSIPPSVAKRLPADKRTAAKIYDPRLVLAQLGRDRAGLLKAFGEPTFDSARDTRLGGSEYNLIGF